MVLAKGHRHTMAMDQSALLEVLEALKAAQVHDSLRQAAETIYQALIDASSVIWAAPGQRTEVDPVAGRASPADAIERGG